MWWFSLPTFALLREPNVRAMLCPLETISQILDHSGFADDIRQGKFCWAMDLGLELRHRALRLQWIEHFGLVFARLSSMSLRYATQIHRFFHRSYCTFVAFICRPFLLGCSSTLRCAKSHFARMCIPSLSCIPSTLENAMFHEVDQ